MNKELELEVVKSAFFLEDKISGLERDDEQLRRNKPQEPMHPTEPRLENQVVDSLPYPKLKVQSKYKWAYFFAFGGALIFLATITAFLNPVIGSLFGMLCIFAGPCGAIGYYFIRKNDKNTRQRELSRSAEYRRQCEEINECNRNRQMELNKELHEKYIRRYENYKKSLPQYEESLIHYKNVEIPEWSEERAVLGAALIDFKSALQELYDRNIIPFPYRNHSALLWLASFLSTSNYDLKTAIERFDTYVLQVQQREQIDVAKAQLMVAQELSQNQQYANWLYEQQVELSEHSNSTLKSISNLQKADIAMREYRRYKAKRAANR